MFVVKRNQIIITALVLMIAVAGYLSYLDMRRDNDNAGFALDDQGNAEALIPNRDALLDENGQTGLIGVPWPNTHDPTIYTYGEIEFPDITDLYLEDIIAIPGGEENLTEAG